MKIIPKFIRFYLKTIHSVPKCTFVHHLFDAFLDNRVELGFC